METTNLNNVKRSCTTASKVLGVISWLVTFAMVLCFAGAGLCFIFHSFIDKILTESPDIAANLSTSITIGGVNMLFKDGNAHALQIGAGCIAAGIALVFLKIALAFIRKIFYTILSSESPFSEEVITTLKKSCILITVFMLLSAGIGIGLIVGLFLWCIYTIFQYGSDLQKQADETI